MHVLAAARVVHQLPARLPASLSVHLFSFCLPASLSASVYITTFFSACSPACSLFLFAFFYVCLPPALFTCLSSCLLLRLPACFCLCIQKLSHFGSRGSQDVECFVSVPHVEEKCFNRVCLIMFFLLVEDERSLEA